MKVPASIPSFSSEDIDYILNNFKEILEGKSFLSQYKFSEIFEVSFSEYIGSNYGISCNSGTSALELIFRSIDVTDKEVILPSNTFVATANAIINAGGKLVFADCDEDMCLSYDSVLNKITKNTIAICHVHIGGIVSENAVKLASFCKTNDISFIEDAAQAHGSVFQNNKAGIMGDAAAFSFYSTKVMTTGEGGMITTNNKDISVKAKSLREFGKQPNEIYTNVYWALGYNWRMPEVAALMGIRQLKALEKNIKKRRKIISHYDTLLKNKSFFNPIGLKYRNEFNGFKYMLNVDPKLRAQIHKFLLKKNISPSGYVYELPLHKMDIFSEHNKFDLPNSDAYCSSHFCLPVYPKMTEDEVDYVITNFCNFFN
jgi:perosamine synthetase